MQKMDKITPYITIISMPDGSYQVINDETVIKEAGIARCYQLPLSHIHKGAFSMWWNYRLELFGRTARKNDER